MRSDDLDLELLDEEPAPQATPVNDSRSPCGNPLPLLPVLGLGVFLWIFLTNTLPALRLLEDRQQVLKDYVGDQGILDRLERELQAAEDLHGALESNLEIQQAYWLQFHPSAEENAPETLLAPLPELPVSRGPIASGTSSASGTGGASSGALGGRRLSPTPAHSPAPRQASPRRTSPGQAPRRVDSPRRSAPAANEFVPPPFLLR